MAQQKQPETIARETVIVSAPSEDVSTWAKYAVTYYKRSIKEKSSEETRNNNREKYLEYKQLLETAGKTVTELDHALKIT